MSCMQFLCFRCIFQHVQPLTMIRTSLCTTSFPGCLHTVYQHIHRNDCMYSTTEDRWEHGGSFVQSTLRLHEMLEGCFWRCSRGSSPAQQLCARKTKGRFLVVLGMVLHSRFWWRDSVSCCRLHQATLRGRIFCRKWRLLPSIYTPIDIDLTTGRKRQCGCWGDTDQNR